MALSKTQEQKLEALARLVRYNILVSTTKAGSGHPTSSLSAVDLMTVLAFGGFFSADLSRPAFPNNDRLIFSKGHASPLLYSLYAVAGKISLKELYSLRAFGSRLEGHPTMRFPFTESPTGSLGQGLSIGVGMALNAKYLDKLPYTTYVLLGDSEMAEGSVWEAIQLASHYKLNNLVGIIDVNRLGQRGQTMYGHNTSAYERRIKSFGWKTIVIDGHNLQAVHRALAAAQSSSIPSMIIAKTIKGKGVSFLENKNDWHGKALAKDDIQKALNELGHVPLGLTGTIQRPKKKSAARISVRQTRTITYNKASVVATREAYGDTLAYLASHFSDVVALDAEVSNSTYAEKVKITAPEKFFEMFIAEQNMVGTALGMARRGKVPYVSSFAAFFSRAHDQIRMSQFANAHIVFCGSHAGVSIGDDGASQMGIEDIAMFRTLQQSTVLYPADANATKKLVIQARTRKGLVYIRTTRMKTPILYPAFEEFPVGKSKTLRKSKKDNVTIIAAGITVHESLRAYNKLLKGGITARVIDVYSIKPIDVTAIRKAIKETDALFVVEDHVPEGGIVDAVRAAAPGSTKPIISLAVTKEPQSGTPQELLHYEGISAEQIFSSVRSFLT